MHADRLIGYFSTLQAPPWLRASCFLSSPLPSLPAQGVEEGEAVSQCVDKTRQRLPRPKGTRADESGPVPPFRPVCESVYVIICHHAVATSHLAARAISF